MSEFKKASIRDSFDLADPSERPTIGTAETSMNFDLEDVLPFLESLHVLGDIYTPIGALAFKAELIADIPVGETRSYEVVGGSRGEMHLLTIEAFMDDIDAPDLRFIGTPKMIEQIDTKLQTLEDRMSENTANDRLI